MKDRYHKKANVLGIDVSMMRVDKAVNVSMELMRGKGLPVIYFLSAVSSLLCQNNAGAAEYVVIWCFQEIVIWSLQYAISKRMGKFRKG